MKVVYVSNKVDSVTIPVFEGTYRDGHAAFGARIIELDFVRPDGRRSGVDTETETLFITEKPG